MTLIGELEIQYLDEVRLMTSQLQLLGKKGRVGMQAVKPLGYAHLLVRVTRKFRSPEKHDLLRGHYYKDVPTISFIYFSFFSPFLYPLLLALLFLYAFPLCVGGNGNFHPCCVHGYKSQNLKQRR